MDIQCYKFPELNTNRLHRCGNENCLLSLLIGIAYLSNIFIREKNTHIYRI